MQPELDGKFYNRPTVYIETKVKPSQFPKNCLGVATYTFRMEDGHHKGYLYGFARTDDTFRALVLDRIIQDHGLPLNVYCRGLYNAIQHVTGSTTGLSSKGKPYHNYEVLKRLGGAMKAGDLHVLQSGSSQRDMWKEQLEAFQWARELFDVCNKHVEQHLVEIELNDEYTILKSSFSSF